jgi:hypothetical protein
VNVLVNLENQLVQPDSMKLQKSASKEESFAE